MEEKIIAAGGQAVIEGVMMRSPKQIAIAVRTTNGRITVKKQPVKSLADKIRIFKLPFLRGILSLFEMLAIGMRALIYSANEAIEEDEEELSFIHVFISILLAIGFGLFLFKFFPLLITEFLNTKIKAISSHYWLFNLVDGLLKIFLLGVYIGIISLMQDVKRVFMYHGAEHKAVNCYENKTKLTVRNVQKFSTLHPRCGTSFILIVFVLSIFVYTFIPKEFSFLFKLILRILLLPIIAGISYEILKLCGKFRENFLIKMVTMPGLALQKLTTRQPTDDQVQVAIRALNSVVK
jgi:uncharacterized protein YqhQ